MRKMHPTVEVCADGHTYVPGFQEDVCQFCKEISDRNGFMYASKRKEQLRKSKKDRRK